MKTLFPLLLAAAAVHADTLETADLAKLRDPARRDAEVARLAGIEDLKELAGYRFLTAAQKSGDPLYLLSVSREYRHAAISALSGGYQIEKPEELFKGSMSAVPFQLEPSLDPVRESVLMVFNSKGREIRPFGGNNYTDEGYFHDFDRDGVLDRAEFTNYGVDEAPDTTITVFELQSVEPKPRSLLEVIYNWHPDSADDANEWRFSCEDADKDGFPEISFGPADSATGKARPQVVFRWDPAARRFSAGDVPEKSHVRVIQPGESLKSIALSGGLGYPLVADPSKPGSGTPTSQPPAAPYVFRSFKDRPDAEIAAFFQGKERRDHWDGPEGSFPNKLPDNLTSLPAKQAALAIAEANRTEDHKKGYQIALDDRGGVQAPASGWLVNDWGSSGCYSYSSQLTALRFGVPEPVLLVFEYNRIGVVGRNPWADQPAHSVRIIKLRPDEARFIADTVFWLDRIRTFSPRKEDFQFGGGFSSADGHATLELHADGAAPRELAAETVWATSTLSAGWNKDYTREVFLNLAQHLINTGIPRMLGDRWNVAPEIGYHNLATPTGERLAPRVDADARRQLAESYELILKRMGGEAAPARILARIANAAGEEALTELLPALRGLLVALPAETDEDREFAALEKRVGNDFEINPPAARKKEIERLRQLRDQREFSSAAILREPLAAAVSRLVLAQNPADLMNAAAADVPDSPWALRQLRRSEPEAWAKIIASQFQKGDVESRRTMFDTLAAGHPPTAKRIIAGLSTEEKSGLINEITTFHQEHDKAALAGDVPALMDLVRDRKHDHIRRGGAMGLLAGVPLPEETLKEFSGLLEKEIQDPQTGEYGMNTLSSAVRALAALPDAAGRLELIAKSPRISKEAFEAGIDAIVRHAPGEEERKALLAGFIRPCLRDSAGMMNSIFLHALAFDVRELTPDLAAFATEGPDVIDGDATNYSGGNFKGPVGQRYHIAREITALWSETDPQTVARMWVFFAAAHADPFNPEYSDTRMERVLSDLAAVHIRQLPDTLRADIIRSALDRIRIPAYAAASETWLRSLCK